MNDLFETIRSIRKLPTESRQKLDEAGFAIIPGPAEPERLCATYESSVAAANPDDVSMGSATTRVSDLINYGPDIDELYVFASLLEAACRIIGGPFKLSSLHARTLRPSTNEPQGLHVDIQQNDAGYPLAGFIFMVDEFRADNGATRFLPGSHRSPNVSEDQGTVVSACGPAGSLIVFNGSVMHGHGLNSSNDLRRSIQGAFIRREGRSALDFPARVNAETLTRLTSLAKYLLSI